MSAPKSPPLPTRIRGPVAPSTDKAVPAEYVGVLEPNYYCRAWNGKEGRKKYCRARAGARTDHPGVGRCYHHSGTKQVFSGRYSTIQRPRISALIAAFQDDPDPLDLTPEVHALRAIVVDFIERWDETTEALLAWHESWDARRDLPQDLTQAFRELVEEHEALLGERTDPTPKQTARAADARKFIDILASPSAGGKPRQILDLSDAARLLDYVGKMVERIEKIRVGSHLSEHPEFRRIMGAVGAVVQAEVGALPGGRDVLVRIHQGLQAIPR